MGRKSLAEVEARRNDIYEMLLEGKPKAHIVSYCASNWGVKLSAVEKDIASVRQELTRQFQQEKDEIVAEHVARYENLYRFYMDKGTSEEPNIFYHPETAAKMLEKKEKLLHMYNPEVAVQVNNIQLPKEFIDVLQNASTNNLKKALELLQ